MSDAEIRDALKRLRETYGRSGSQEPSSGPQHEDDNTRITDRLDHILLLLAQLGEGKR